jgi:hypothetical protein
MGSTAHASGAHSQQDAHKHSLARFPVSVGLSTMQQSHLKQQQLVKGLKDVDAGLVDGHHHGVAASCHSLDCLHHNGGSTSIQACTQAAGDAQR